MINLRYHIVSIVAVFLALAIGLALGSTFVDSVLVSNLEFQVDQLEEDTLAAIAERTEAVEARDEALASIDAARAERVEVETLVSPYLPQGRLSGTTALVVAPEGTDAEAVAAIRARLIATDAELGGVLWLSDDLRLDAAAVRRQIADAFSLAGDSRDAIRRALRFLVPQALYRPDEAGSSTGVGHDVEAVPDAAALDGFSPGFAAVPTTRTALTVLRDLGLVTHDGTRAIALHRLGGETLRLVVVTDAASAGLNTEFVFDLLDVIAAQGHEGTGVIVEVPALATDDAAAGAGYGSVLAGVQSDAVLRSAFSTVDGVDTFSGDLALLVALEKLPQVGHYSWTDLSHGFGTP